jgi:hypothetical protein
VSRPIERAWASDLGELYLGEKDTGGGAYLKREHLTTHAHFLGRTDSGKTRLLQHIGGELAHAGDAALLVLDPYGGLAHYLKDYCYQNGMAARLITLDAGDALTHGILTGFNPLVRAASPQAAAAAASLALKSAVGDTSDPIQTPRLVKWAFATNLGLQASERYIMNGLTMGDARHVLRFKDNTYRAIFAEILAELDPDTADLWEWLGQMQLAGSYQTAKAFNEELGSLGSRISLYTKIPQILSMLATRRYAVDAFAAIQEKRIIVANLSRFTPAGALLFEESEQKILGTQILHTFLAAAMSRPVKARTPLFVIADEFQHFLCPEVETILTGGRQFGIHLILAHQHLTQLQDITKDDWRYYQAVIGGPRVRVVFGQGGTVDTETMGREMFYNEVDLEKVKQEIHRTIQIQRVKGATFRTEISGGGDMSASGTGALSGSGATYRGGDAGGMFSTPQPIIESLQSAMNDFNISGSNSFYASGKATGPMVQPDPPSLELGSREFWTAEEQFFQFAQRIRAQAQQHAVLGIRGDDPLFFRVVEVRDPEHDTEGIQPLDRERLEAATRAALPSPDGKEHYLAGRVEDIADEARQRDAAFRKLLKPRPPAAAKKRAATARVLATRDKRLGDDRKDAAETSPKTRAKTPGRRQPKG